jgi:hypothetical protein
MLKKILNILRIRKKTFVTPRQKEIFDSDLQKEIDTIVEKLRKENEEKDKKIENLLLDIFLLKNDIEI